MSNTNKQELIALLTQEIALLHTRYHKLLSEDNKFNDLKETRRKLKSLDAELNELQHNAALEN